MPENAPALTCTICGDTLKRRLSVLGEPGDPQYPSHAACRLKVQLTADAVRRRR